MKFEDDFVIYPHTKVFIFCNSLNNGSLYSGNMNLFATITSDEQHKLSV